MRKAFTLIEMMISITILSIIMIFLYQSYASLNISNSLYKKELNTIRDALIKKKVIFLDFSLILDEKIKILNQEIDEDVVFMQSSNSIHRRYNPYIAYLVRDSKLYRLESLHEFKEYPFSFNNEFVSDYLGEVNSFRVYKSNDNNESYMVHVDFKKDKNILLKIKILE